MALENFFANGFGSQVFASMAILYEEVSTNCKNQSKKFLKVILPGYFGNMSKNPPRLTNFDTNFTAMLISKFQLPQFTL